jgi:predicted nucleic acid-binding protein
MKAHLDTAVPVAASVSDHTHHSQALALLQKVRAKEISGYISGHGLSEVYAVLTPFTPPVYPVEAWKLLSENILPYFQIVILTPKMYVETIQECASKGWIGGKIYDALHLRSARKSACDRIYTFNVRHFRQLAPDLSARIGAA